MNFRRIFCISSAVLCFVANGTADVVSKSDAMKMAQQFMSANGMAMPVAVSDAPAVKLKTSSAKADAPAYHLIYAADSSACVVVAGDDIAKPILGYTTQPVCGELPPAMQEWLADIEQQILQAREKGVSQSEAVANEWASADEIGDIVVQLNTAKWKQGAPLNAQCPLDGKGERTITGCIATSFGIIMKHYGYPAKGRGTIPAYTTGGGIAVPARDVSDHTYQWDNMLMEYNTGEYTQEQADAVAMLLADVGAACQANYGVHATSAVQGLGALFAHFDFNPGIEKNKDDFSADEWNSMLRAELDKSRPVWYAGCHADGGGHAFLLDGYTENNYFSVNWGWGGYCNGFFALDAMQPDEDTEYNSDQQAYFDVVPAYMLPAVAEVGDGIQCPSLSAAFSMVPSDGTPASVKLLQNISASSLKVAEGKSLSLELNGRTMTFTGDYGMTNRGSFTITDGVGGGQICGEVNDALISNYGTLTVESGTLANTCASVEETDYRRCLYSYDGSVSNLKGGTFINNAAAQTLCLKGDVTITGGTFENKGNSAVLGQFTGTLTISGGTFENKGNSAVLSQSSGMLTIKGGTFTNSNNVEGSTNYSRCLYTTAETSVIIEGGVFTNEATTQTVCISGTGEIRGGTFENKGTGRVVASDGNVTISDGRFSGSLYVWDGASLLCSGGLYSANVANKFLAEGFQCVANTDAETSAKYPFCVIDPTTGLDFIANAPAADGGLRYNLNGVQVKAGTSGLNIISKGFGQGVKVLSR